MIQYELNFNAERGRTQNEIILDYLKAGNSLTSLEALELCGCFRLGARINDLKADGNDIVSQMVNRGGKWVAKYQLVRQEALCGY